MAATFTYKVRDKEGKVHSGSLEAASASAAAKALRDKGLSPINVEEQGASALKKEIKIPGLTDRVKTKDVAVFSRQFATMINSGLSLLRSLSILIEQTESRGLAKAIEAIKVDVERGASLSAAMEKHPKAFNRLFVAMVKAGEVGGVLDETLLRLADTLEAQVELRSKIRSAMMYPIAVFLLVFFIVAAMLIFIVPMFESLYADLGCWRRPKRSPPSGGRFCCWAVVDSSPSGAGFRQKRDGSSSTASSCDCRFSGVWYTRRPSLASPTPLLL